MVATVPLLLALLFVGSALANETDGFSRNSKNTGDTTRPTPQEYIYGRVPKQAVGNQGRHRNGRPNNAPAGPMQRTQHTTLQQSQQGQFPQQMFDYPFFSTMTPPPQLVPPPAFPPAPKIDGMHASFTPPPAAMNMMEYAANMFKEAQKIHEETREYSNHIRQESQRYFGEISRMRDSVLRMYASHNTRCAQWEVVSAYRGTRELSEALATGFKPFQVDADGQHHLRKCKRRSFPEIPVLRK